MTDATAAHWYTNATAVTSGARPRAIHDFYGFPEELFAVDYPASADPAPASRVVELLEPTWVHKLSRGDWGQPDGSYDWARRFDEKVTAVMTPSTSDILSVVDDGDYALAVPTSEPLHRLAVHDLLRPRVQQDRRQRSRAGPTSAAHTCGRIQPLTPGQGPGAGTVLAEYKRE